MAGFTIYLKEGEDVKIDNEPDLDKKKFSDYIAEALPKGFIAIVGKDKTIIIPRENIRLIEVY